MFASIFDTNKEFINLTKRIGKGKMQIVGLNETGQLLFTQKLCQQGPVLAVFATQEEAKKFYLQAAENFGKKQVLYFPPAPYLPIAILARSRDAVRLRAEVLHRVATDEKLLVVASVEALTWKVPHPDYLKKRRLVFKVGEKADLNEITSILISFGYERLDIVNESGQFAKRGGIIDIFPLGSEMPVRMELWGDEIDSLRTFDSVSQRSQDNLRQFEVLPVNELTVSREEMSEAAEKLAKELSRHKGHLAKLKEKGALKSIEEQIVPFIDAFKEGIFKEGAEQFTYLFSLAKNNVVDFFEAGSVLVVDEKKTFENLAAICRDKELALADYLNSGFSLPGYAENLWTAEETKNYLNQSNVLNLELIPHGTTAYVSFINKDISVFNADSTRIKSAIQGWLKSKYSIIFTAPNPEQGQRLQSYLKDLGYQPTLLKEESFPLNQASIYLAVGFNFKGVEWPGQNIVLLGYATIFGVSKKRTQLTARKSGQKIASFLELKPGDYVVHTNHGIGIYKGIEKVTALGVEKDYLVIQYAGTDTLYVPTEQVERVQKYVGAEGHTPKLNKLGGTDWAKAKKRIKESVQEMARELLKLYAERRAQPGFAFPKDSLWQKEFEDAFPYEETPDQKRAIAEIKADMERPTPMDRLLCGDVGYGKTEVAMRAAFKAVSAGKQVAVLVPTTVLAQQHEQTFFERFGNFPVKIASISRFKSPKEQKAILEGVKTGAIDIIIGTHRLLSKDVLFKDLGLLIIDEEQRFGVAHKERIKQIKTHVDVLTLTATPIPRTLHMSLVGMRDMSIIETPPEDRLPVQTYVLEYNDRIIEEAIKQELYREGQVFFVHNRIEDLRKVAERVQNLVPEARLLVAHGQMHEDELEDVMYTFINHEADVLVTTTIIESGLDLPNVNTLIVHDADRMGLSQLYQLRGRVGRSARQAYAYFTYRRDKILTEIAQKRLKAIRDFTELGSGFKIAMRDLELRGAGNILGPEQHGHIMAVGFDMYVRLLEEAVEELKGAKPKVQESVTLELPVSAFLPDEYIEDAGIKTEIYHKLLAAQNEEDVEDIREETEDRFGNLPPQTENLFALSKIRILAQGAGIKQIGLQNNQLVFFCNVRQIFKSENLTPLVKKYGRNLTLDFQRGSEVRLKITSTSEKEILNKTREVLLDLRALSAHTG